MKEIQIMLSSVENIRNFVNEVILVSYDVDLVQGRYTIDAKSIMGIYSLDLSKPVTIEIHSDDCDALVEELKPFIQ